MHICKEDPVIQMLETHGARKEMVEFKKWIVKCHKLDQEVLPISLLLSSFFVCIFFQLCYLIFFQNAKCYNRFNILVGNSMQTKTKHIAPRSSWEERRSKWETMLL